MTKAIKYIGYIMLLLGSLVACGGHRLRLEKPFSEDAKKVSMLREGMTRSQVNEILKPSKEGIGYSIGGVERGFYWLSSESGVWLDYNLSDARKRSPTDTLLSQTGTLQLSVMDNGVGKWIRIPISPSK